MKNKRIEKVIDAIIKKDFTSQELKSIIEILRGVYKESLRG